MVIQFNACIAEILVPAQLACVLALTTICNFVILKVHLNALAITIPVIVADVGCMGFIYVAMREGSQFLVLSQRVLVKRKPACDSHYLIKKLKACPPFGGKVGSFRMVDKTLLLIVYAAIVDYTITLSLTYNAKDD